MTDAFVWDPDPVLFTIPFVDHPIRWYGLFFALGFMVGYLLLLPRAKPYAPKNPQKLADTLLIYMIVGTVVGARAGFFLFYDPYTLLSSPLEFFRIWNGGLASHGGVIGIFFSLWVFLLRHKKEYPTLTFLRLLDLLSIPAALVCASIRLGNFINQEIVGTPTTLPWAVQFLHPMEHVPPIPRHPTQLYEALAYFTIFLLLLILEKRWQLVKAIDGALAGALFVLVFGARFLLDFTKEESGAFSHTSLLQVGQWLCIPFILFGLFLLLRARRLGCVRR